MNYFDGAYENRELGLDSMTEGISIEGMQQLLDDLRVNVLESVSTQLEQTEEIVSALNKGWQGAARDAFVLNFSKSIEEVKDGLNAEYRDLLRKFGELSDNYFNEDNRMVDLVG